MSVLAPLPVYFIVYDFFYATTHMALHQKGIYAYIHKHHHRQQAPRWVHFVRPPPYLTTLSSLYYFCWHPLPLFPGPQSSSRGSEDSINIHPLEFCLGHINAIVALFLVCRVLQVHIMGSNLIQLIYAGTSCFNHSRHDVELSIGGITIWNSKDHDVHHRIPNKNYGRVIMLWDRLFGTFRYDLWTRLSALIEYVQVQFPSTWTHQVSFSSLVDRTTTTTPSTPKLN